MRVGSAALAREPVIGFPARFSTGALVGGVGNLGALVGRGFAAVRGRGTALSRSPRVSFIGLGLRSPFNVSQVIRSSCDFKVNATCISRSGLLALRECLAAMVLWFSMPPSPIDFPRNEFAGKPVHCQMIRQPSKNEPVAAVTCGAGASRDPGCFGVVIGGLPDDGALIGRRSFVAGVTGAFF